VVARGGGQPALEHREPILGAMEGGGSPSLALYGGVRSAGVLNGGRPEGRSLALKEMLVSSKTAAAVNRGGRHARARPDGEKQRARRLGPRLSLALLRDEAPHNGGIWQMSSIERHRGGALDIRVMSMAMWKGK
jgi:hypothetical protein